MDTARKSECRDRRKRILEHVWMLLLAVGLFLYYFSNLKNINIVWELPDEAGYLYNAACLAGKDWSSYTSAVGKAYYGYGYSIVLIPLFFICKTGVELVKSAILLNYFFVICSYFLQNYIFAKLFKRNKYIIACTCFVVNLFPYMIVSANKVICETYLSLQVWVIAALIFKLLDKNKKRYYILTGAFTGYIYMVHTRAIAVIVVVCALLIVYSYIKKERKSIFIFLFSFLVIWAIGQAGKNYLINIMNQGDSSGSTEVANLISVNFMIQRLGWLFHIKSIGPYIVSACCRFFYIIASTGLMVFWALKYILNQFSRRSTKIIEWETSHWMLIYFGMVFFIMFAMCCVSGSGVSSDFAYTFYGRYIEYVLSPLVGIGILSYLNIDKHETSYMFALIILMGVMTGLEINYLETDNIRADTARMAGFSFWILKNRNYISFVYSQTLLLVISYLILIIAQREKIKYIIFIFVSVLFLANNKECIKIINGVNRGKSSEIEISNYISKRMVSRDIYYINIGYQYIWDYARMQVLLPDESLNVINVESDMYLLEDAFIIAYSDTEIVDKLSEYYRLVLSTETYCLFASNE